MPLSPAAARQPIHHRSINCKGYQREDGLWDIEAHLRDNKFVPFHTQTRGDLSPEDAVHDMWIRITVDDDYLIHDLEAVIDASPFVVCPEITSRFQLLKGLRIGAGWNKMLKELLGDVLHPFGGTVWAFGNHCISNHLPTNPRQTSARVRSTSQ